MNRKHHLRTNDIDLETIIQRSCELPDMMREEMLAANKNRRTVHARSPIDYGAYVDLLGTSKEHELNLVERQDSDNVVPFDDKRSIRRIVLHRGILGT